MTYHKNSQWLWVVFFHFPHPIGIQIFRNSWTSMMVKPLITELMVTMTDALVGLWHHSVTEKGSCGFYVLLPISREVILLNQITVVGRKARDSVVVTRSGQCDILRFNHDTTSHQGFHVVVTEGVSNDMDEISRSEHDIITTFSVCQLSEEPMRTTTTATVRPESVFVHKKTENEV